MDNLKELYNYFAKQKESNWIMRPENVQRLYQFVKENLVKKVLELGLGIGCSASVISLALKEKKETDYFIDSIEQSIKCIDLANKIVPEELKEKIIIHNSGAAVWETKEIPFQYFSVYDSLPEALDYDLILIDGCSPFLSEGNYIDLPNGDIIKFLLEGKIKPNTFVAFDGRLISLKIIERYFSNNFYLVKVDYNSDFNVIQRKDNAVHFFDEKLEFMKQAGYFNV